METIKRKRKNLLKKNVRMIRVPEADYQMLRRDRRAKKEIRALVLMLYDKVKNWK